jgi:Symplekin/PTA1 N-terminal
MQAAVLGAITAPADISSVVIKFAETLVMAYVPGRGLGPYAAKEGDKSVHSDLPHSHPFLRKTLLESEGHQLAQQMTTWLRTGEADGAR